MRSEAAREAEAVWRRRNEWSELHRVTVKLLDDNGWSPQACELVRCVLAGVDVEQARRWANLARPAGVRGAA